MVRTICPSLPMRMKAFGVNAAPAAPSAEWAAPVLKPMRSPPPSAALALRNCRRERSTAMSGPFLGGVLDSLADSHIRATATDVPRHGGVDIAIGRVGLGGEQRRCGHDLAGLAIAALRHLQLDPGLLDLLAGGGGSDGLDRRDALAGRGRDRRDARAHRLAIKMDRARTAQSEAATEFRAGHSEHIPNHPKQRRVVVDIDAARFAVDCQRLCHLSLLKAKAGSECGAAVPSVCHPIPALSQSTQIRILECSCEDGHRWLLASAVSAAIISACLAYFLRSRRFASSKRLPDT